MTLPAVAPISPKVSVVTCSHNRPALLRNAVESLRAQTDPDWEHLIYDDCSTHPGVKETLLWALEDPRVRVWQGQTNLDRPSVLWNFMLDRAHGRYFTVLDDDNEKLPTFVERMGGLLDVSPSLDLVTCGWRVDRSVGEPEGDYFLNLSTSSERLATLSTCDGGAMLYRRETFERAGYFSEALRTNEDWDWLRRAAHFGTLQNLHEVHSTYRSHDESRMRRAHLLGNDADVRKVKERLLSTDYGVRPILPPMHRLTPSQRDVCDGLQRGLASIPWVTPNGNDLHLAISPFQMKTQEVELGCKGAKRVLSLHMEDPYALASNLERVQRMNAICETWVATNDASCVPYYRKVVGDRVLVYPSLSADDGLTGPAGNGARDIDMLICGYAYPSRREFVRRLLPSLDPNLRVTLVGDGWKETLPDPGRVQILPTQPLASTYRLHSRARAVVALHRVHGDCSDGVANPVTLNRGFLEGYSGAAVFLDRSRTYHALDPGDVVWFENERDLADKLHGYLAGSEAGHDPGAFAQKCRRQFTYRTRLVRLLNSVRAPRYLAEIP